MAEAEAETGPISVPASDPAASAEAPPAATAEGSSGAAAAGAGAAAAEAPEETVEDEAEYFVEDEAEDGSPSEVVVVMCILNQGGDVLKGRRIWRRLALPGEFTLLELHVALQNAFDWEDTHLHDFSQPTCSTLAAQILNSAPDFAGVGRTDTAAFAQHMIDVDELPLSELRTFKGVVGVKEEPGPNLLLTRAEKFDGEGGEEGKGKRSCLVYVEHSHPHADPEGEADGGGKSLKLVSGPTQVLEERAFTVHDVLTRESPVLIYEYDFRISYEVHCFLEAKCDATEGVNYPTCLAGAGASPAEDGDDMDDEGNLLPSYDYEDFAVLDVIANLEKTFEDAWPVGPGSKKPKESTRCYLCRYNRECGRRRECSGKCCDYCVKSPLAEEVGRLTLSEAKQLFDAAAATILDARKQWVETGTSEWTEDDA